MLLHGESEHETRRGLIEKLKAQSEDGRYDCELIDRRQLQSMLPLMELGPNIVGASYSPHDGHVNPLLLLRAFHTAFRKAGGRFFSGTPATYIRNEGGEFIISTGKGQFRAAKLVLAAGLAIPGLAAMLDMKIPVEPERGQILVTERVQPCLPYPINGIRQTVEGSFMFGSSNEQVGYNTDVTIDIMRNIAQRATGAFPILNSVRVVRSWADLRPLTPDHFPIYTESRSFPGAYVLTSHSGVSLASMYAGVVARWIIDGTQPEGFDEFSPGRFDV